jgi:hypothetical protein
MDECAVADPAAFDAVTLQRTRRPRTRREIASVRPPPRSLPPTIQRYRYAVGSPDHVPGLHRSRRPDRLSDGGLTAS